MDVTFITTVNLDDLSDLPGQAADMANDLSTAGWEVKSVTPWARPSLTQSTMSQTTNQQQTTNQEPIQ